MSRRRRSESASGNSSKLGRGDQYNHGVIAERGFRDAAASILSIVPEARYSSLELAVVQFQDSGKINS